MAFHNSPSSSPPDSSAEVSPDIRSRPLDSMSATDDFDTSSVSTHGTPSRSTTSLPRTQNAGKGGCWTCRVRRKKCDEEREDGSCRTCKRLTIHCLGWGAKRPDWMRDKSAVDAYKASIKAQLSRAGLIRGQPRHHRVQTTSQREVSSSSSAGNEPSTNGNHATDYDSFNHLIDPTFVQPSHLIPGMPVSSNSTFDVLASSPYEFDPSQRFHYQVSLPGTSSFSMVNDPLNEQAFDLFQTPMNDHLGFLEPLSTVSFNPNAIHEELVIHYFGNVHKVQFFLAGEALTSITYSAITEEPRGAVAQAVYALADLHSKQTRISQGLESPSLNPENSSTNYLMHEALFKLENNRSTNRMWTDNDALAALHLVTLSQLSGGASDWSLPFSFLCQWLQQTNLHLADDTWVEFLKLSTTAQVIVKATLWVDTFSSFSEARAPKFLKLLQRLILEPNNSTYWSNNNRFRMDLLTGCTDEALLAIAEVSNLAYWKTSQIRNSCLSYPELIRRGQAIEHRLRRTSSEVANADERGANGSAVDERTLIAKIFRESAVLYLHTVLSNSTPGVPEIGASVDVIVRLLSKLPPSDLDRTLVFPICLTGCMTNDSSRRDFLKNRIRSMNETYGNLLQTRRLMEAVWQKRDVGGKDIDVRETIGDQGLKLLLI